MPITDASTNAPPIGSTGEPPVLASPDPPPAEPLPPEPVPPPPEGRPPAGGRFPVASFGCLVCAANTTSGPDRGLAFALSANTTEARCVFGLTDSSMKSSSERSRLPGLTGAGSRQIVPRMQTPLRWLGTVVISWREMTGLVVLAALICANHGYQRPLSVPIADVSFCSQATSMTPGLAAAPVLNTIEPLPFGRPSMRFGVLQCAPLSLEQT